MTKEQIDQNNRLESIFIPYAWRGRKKMDPSGQTQFVRFVHYTSAEAALKIIEQKQIWMRSAACMNDYMEVQTGFNIMQSFFSNQTNEANFVNIVNRVAEGAAQEAIQNFNKWWNPGIVRFQTYILSVSEHDPREDKHGRLSMWRAASSTKPRVAIVFNPTRNNC